MQIWRNDPINRDRVLESIVKLNNTLAQLSVKLRIANTSVYGKKDGILTERGDPAAEEGESNVTKFPSDLLYGEGEPLLMPKNAPDPFLFAAWSGASKQASARQTAVYSPGGHYVAERIGDV
jgi:hypothetical protein